MSSSHFFRSAPFGLASLRLLTKTQIRLTTGPIQRTTRDLFKQPARSLHISSLASMAPDNGKFVAIGGGASALAHINQFCTQFKARFGIMPFVSFFSDESSHWINLISKDYYERPWGQPKEALLKVFQDLMTELFPLVAANQYPTLLQIQIIRKEFIRRICLHNNIEFVDTNVQKIQQEKESETINLICNEGKILQKLPINGVKLFNFSTIPRTTANPSLVKFAREGGYLYSEEKSDKPICMIGGGLSAVWAAQDHTGPMIVLRKRNFPMTVNVPNSRVGFSELIEEDSEVRILKQNSLLVEGTDIRTGETIRMRFDRKSCFLSLGTQFNSQLTAGLSLEIVNDIDPFSYHGKKAGAMAVGTINPEGGLVHRVAVISHLLGRYPVEDFANMARYTNLWRGYVSVELSKKGILLDDTYFDLAQPRINQLFFDKHVPTTTELEKILYDLYEKIPDNNDKPHWSQIKDILVPITEQFEASIHPHAQPTSLARPSF